MSSQVITSQFSKEDEKEFKRLRDKMDTLRQNQLKLDIEAMPNNERKKLERAVGTLNDQVATLQRNVISNYRSEYAVCRHMGHSWQVKEEVVNGNRLYQTLMCARCTMVREDIFNRTGQRIADAKYTYPEGYTLSSPIKATVGFSKDFWRGIQFMRVERS